MRRVSVVINTYNRDESLRTALRSLELLDYPNFEVVVVNGPSSDNTEQVIAEFSGRIKVGRTPHRNLSESRNIGIALAAGEIVAFIDDDAYPDPAWLDAIVEGYDSDEVAGVGGPLYDHTGVNLQVRYSVVDRFGRGNLDLDVNPTPFFNRPYALQFAHLVGANSSFRRDRLVDIGGFDEEFEYFLDESDICCRLVDRGWVIRELDDGFVYHKFLPSDVRNANRAIRDRHNVVKNTVYFAMKHGLPTYSFAMVCEHLGKFIAEQHWNYRSHVRQGELTESDYERFEADLPLASDEGFKAHQRGFPRHPDAAMFLSPPEFLPFSIRRLREQRLHICFFSQEWLPEQLNGIARVLYTLATGLAASGHIVHVLTRGEDHDRVDLEDGVWVHRIAVTPHAPPAGFTVPGPIWNHSASMLDELHRIQAQRSVDIVHVPNWDSEGIAVLLDGRFTTVLGLYTPVKTVREIDQSLGAAGVNLDQLEHLERYCYEHASGLLACGPSIVAEIEQRYELTLPAERIGFAPHGLPEAPADVAPPREPHSLNVLFVGRLEARKGIDTLLACIPSLADEFPDIGFTIAGRDDLPAGNGRSYRDNFEHSHDGRRLSDRVRFTGAVGDADLLEYYAGCDLFVAPSRYESFGLILLEAMRVGKPVVACRVGGMTEVVEDGSNGFLVEPGDSEALRAAIAQLAGSPALRRKLGKRSRQRFEECFTVARMVHDVNREYDRFSGRTTLLDASADRVAATPAEMMRV